MKPNLIYLKKSERKDKKYTVILNYKDGKRRTVHFGAIGYSDYTIHKDYDRMLRYSNRHKRREDWTLKGIDTAGFWSKHILWNKPGFMASVRQTEKQFGVKIKILRTKTI